MPEAKFRVEWGELRLYDKICRICRQRPINCIVDRLRFVTPLLEQHLITTIRIYEIEG